MEEAENAKEIQVDNIWSGSTTKMSSGAAALGRNDTDIVSSPSSTVLKLVTIFHHIS